MSYTDMKPAPRKKKARPGGNKCPIGADSLVIASLSHDLVRAIRKLRRDLAACGKCETYRGSCPLLSEFHGWINQAIQEVLEEWEYGGVGNG